MDLRKHRAANAFFILVAAFMIMPFLMPLLSDCRSGPDLITGGRGRRELMLFYGQLELGMERQCVLRMWQSSGSEHAWAEFVPSDGVVWSIRTPYQIAARNWLLYIQFREDKICGLHIRERNGIGMIPSMAPRDVVNDRAQPLTYALLDQKSSDAH